MYDPIIFTSLCIRITFSVILDFDDTISCTGYQVFDFIFTPVDKSRYISVMSVEFFNFRTIFDIYRKDFPFACPYE